MNRFFVRSPFCITVLSLLMLAGSGCAAKKKEPKMIYASGVLRIKGKPVADIMVQALPDALAGADGPTTSGITDAEGRFVLKTDTGVEAAVVGPCKIILIDTKEERVPQGQVAPPQRINSRYTIAGPQGLSAEIREDGKSIEIDLLD
jgi:hypothetical protein